jgi:phosphoserine aminotransferase
MQLAMARGGGAGVVAAVLRAAAYAEQAGTSEHQAWADRAYEFMKDFARRHELFTASEVVAAHVASEEPQPASVKEWADVFRRAVDARLIVRVGPTTWWSQAFGMAA